MLHLVVGGGPSSPACISPAPCNVRSAYRKVEHAVATAFRVPVSNLRSRTRGPANVAFARQTAMYLAHTTLGFSLSVTAVAARRDRTTVAHACRLLEQRRDEPAVEAMLRKLEEAIASPTQSGGEGGR